MTWVGPAVCSGSTRPLGQGHPHRGNVGSPLLRTQKAVLGTGPGAGGRHRVSGSPCTAGPWCDFWKCLGLCCHVCEGGIPTRRMVFGPSGCWKSLSRKPTCPWWHKVT